MRSKDYYSHFKVTILKKYLSEKLKVSPMIFRR